jgi:uncharacterized membrane protein
MKYTDIKRIHEAGLITADQEQRIIDHFKLKEHDSRMLTVVSVFGGLLVCCGIVLLIAANWDEIPRGVKIAGGLTLMLGAHIAGWYLREHKRSYPKTGEALHLAGSCLFLGNIALIGQVYHLTSRAPNAFLLWFAGIALLPWILRAVTQHLLALVAFGIWFAFEINERGSPLYFGQDETQLLLYCTLALIYVAGAYLLRLTNFRIFARPTEALGLIALHVFVYPTTWGLIRVSSGTTDGSSAWLFTLMGATALALIVVGCWRLTNLSPQWRLAWAGSLCAMVALFAFVLLYVPEYPGGWKQPFRWLFTATLFAFCLVEVQVGIQRRLPMLVNLGVTFLALTILSAYVNLFGSMARTGVMFLFAGVFLVGFGVYLEKKRRSWLSEALGTPGSFTSET